MLKKHKIDPKVTTTIPKHRYLSSIYDLCTHCDILRMFVYDVNCLMKIIKASIYCKFTSS